MNLEELKFDAQGLIPAVVIDDESGKLLTLAYMNKESLDLSIEKELTCFWSRSRQELWLKGATSGHYQHIVSITADCDGDALEVRVKKDGPACHTGADTCFHNPLWADKEAGLSEKITQEAMPKEKAAKEAANQPFSLHDLMKLIADRKSNPKEGSYTTYLFEKGMDKILKKIGEESTEVIIAAKNDSHLTTSGAQDKGPARETIYEASDLVYHLMVMMIEMGISLEDIYGELAQRHVIDHKVKQEKMTK